MIEIFSHSLLLRYKTFWFSKATLFILFCSAIVFLSPLFISYRSEGFWLRQDSYREQPRILFKHRYLFVIDLDGTNFVQGSTYEAFNQLYPDTVVFPVVSATEYDKDYDGRFDGLKLNLDVPLLPDQHVRGFRMIVIFDYLLQEMSYFRMESMAYIDAGACQLDGARLYLAADLRLKQDEPLSPRGRDFRFNASVLPAENSQIDFNFEHIIQKYLERNITTHLASQYLLWTNGRAAQQPFTISLNIRYPTENIVYVPGFWQLFKWAWIQYLSVLVVFLFIFERIKIFVFQNQLIRTVVQTPLDFRKLHYG